MLITVCSQVFALRNVADGVPDLSSAVAREDAMKQQILTEKKAKALSGIKVPLVKPAPRSYPMPSKEEIARKKANSDKLNIPANQNTNTVSPIGSQPAPSMVMINKEAAQAREKALANEESGSGWPIWLPGAMLLVLLGFGIFILVRKMKVKDNRGNTLLFAVGVLIIVLGIGTSLVYVTRSESQKTVKSSKGNSALYVADAGIEKAMWELNRDASYAGEDGTSLGEGQFTVVVSTPAGFPNKRDILSTSKVSVYSKKIKATVEKLAGNISVDSALTCGGNVNIGGNAHIGGGSITGVLVPVGNNVNTFGSGSVAGNPPTGNAPFPSFEDVFGLTQAQLVGFANAKYYNPANNVACHGITWIEGNFHVNAGWSGSGILIVNGDFDMNGGGQFDGVIYVLGSFHMAGHALIRGSILTQSMVDVAAILGTADILYDPTAISNADSLYPFKIITWQEVK